MMQDIIARIERGVPPWRQAWANGAEPTSPLRSDGQPFTGSNAWLLSFAGAVRGYTSPYWFTFRQALAIGAPVMKGARSSITISSKTRRLVAYGGASGDDYETLGGAEGGGPRVLQGLPWNRPATRRCSAPTS